MSTHTGAMYAMSLGFFFIRLYLKERKKKQICQTKVLFLFSVNMAIDKFFIVLLLLQHGGNGCCNGTWFNLQSYFIVGYMLLDVQKCNKQT